MDYIVRDDTASEHAIVEAPTAIDAVQRYIGIATRPNYTPDPWDISVYPITRKNAILPRVNPLEGDVG